MRVRIRILAGAVVAAMLLVGIGAGTAAQTDATFTDPEVGTAAFTSMRLVPPQIVAVPHCAGLLGTGLGKGVTLDWTWSGPDPYPSFTPAGNAEWAFNSAGNNWQTVATTTQGNGVHRTTFNTGVISDLVTLLLGGTMTFQVRTKLGGTWVSSEVSKVVFHSSGAGALGLSPYCEAPVNGS